MNDPSRPRTDARENEGDALDAADMGRLTAGEETALNDLMSRHADRLFGYLVRSLQNDEDAADVAQETFVRVFQNRARFDASQRFSTWLYAIATNLVKDRYRWRSRHPQVSIDVGNEEAGGQTMKDLWPDQRLEPGESMQREEKAELIRAAIGRLPEELRIPLLLAEYEEKSQMEIAAILNCSVKAVETRIYRARHRLRNDLSSLLKLG